MRLRRNRNLLRLAELFGNGALTAAVDHGAAPGSVLSGGATLTSTSGASANEKYRITVH